MHLCRTVVICNNFGELSLSCVYLYACYTLRRKGVYMLYCCYVNIRQSALTFTIFELCVSRKCKHTVVAGKVRYSPGDTRIKDSTPHHVFHTHTELTRTPFQVKHKRVTQNPNKNNMYKVFHYVFFSLFLCV